MRRIISAPLLAIATYSSSALPLLQGKPALSADDAQAVRQADHALVLAASEQNTTALAALLDTDFTWTNPKGEREPARNCYRTCRRSPPVTPSRTPAQAALVLLFLLWQSNNPCPSPRIHNAPGVPPSLIRTSRFTNPHGS
jgi:hypothetical protein